MTETVSMVDTVHASVGLDLATFPYVAGYISGTDGIKWTAGDWGLFGHARKIRIWQGEGALPEIDAYDVIDVEAGAVSVGQAAREIRDRVGFGIQWTTVYGTDSTLKAVAEAVQAMGHDVWNGHVNCWLADWNLDLAGAMKVVGTRVHGMTCVGVQWASPTSNPNTVLPGGSGKTLREANVDLSVVDAGWVPSSFKAAPKPVPAPVAVKPALVKVVGTFSDGSSRDLWTEWGGVG